MLDSSSPLKEALRRTWISVQRRFSMLPGGAAVGVLLAWILKPTVLAVLSGALLGALLALLLIVALRFPKHHQRALRGE
ncbi:hypothetical protein [Deinococcus roseus]|uniref:Uncharacterized protein n=1 Tax=Deinococcus roseus TaxID=392414 RepID=A0ABQ2DG56_9DEIO|nr:hypothetical protein [Deinococcus roseus]GGJ53269.1 hypothetical protein GCM10008938_44090 [Deinococcus roseus]